MTKIKRTITTMLFLLAGLTTYLPAATITSLHNTGAALPSGAVDPYWTINGQTAYRTQNGDGMTFPVDSYWYVAPNTTTSAWISPQPLYDALHDSDPAGNYAYITNFDLTGFDAATASISFRVASDNQLVDVRLNGTSIGGIWPELLMSPTSVLDFSFQYGSIRNGFVGGMNTLEFDVVNFAQEHNNPSGLHAALEGNAEQVPGQVPEPGTVVMIGMGLVVVGWTKRKR